MKANETHYFSNLFHKVLYMFRTGSLSIIRSISTLYTRNRYLSCQFCWRLLQQTYLLRVYSVEILLMMDSGLVRNTQSTLSYKCEKMCISLAFIIRIHHDARSSERQIRKNSCCGVLRYEAVQHGRWKHTFQTQLLPSSTLKRYSEDSLALRNICSPATDHAILRTKTTAKWKIENYFHLLDDGFSNFSARTTTGTLTTVC